MKATAGMCHKLSLFVVAVALSLILSSHLSSCTGMLASTSEYGADGKDIFPLRRQLAKFSQKEQEFVERCFKKGRRNDRQGIAMDVVKRVLHEDGFNQDEMGFVFEFFSNLLSKYVELGPLMGHLLENIADPKAPLSSRLIESMFENRLYHCIEYLMKPESSEVLTKKYDENMRSWISNCDLDVFGICSMQKVSPTLKCRRLIGFSTKQ